MLNTRFLVLGGIVLILGAARLIPHPWNVTPLAALALFGGAYFASKKVAFAVPLVALILSDIALSYVRDGFTSFYLWTLVFGYACFILTVALGLWVRMNRSFLRVGLATLTASVLFFLVTNFGFWLLDRFAALPYYGSDLQGLFDCYVRALPFFRNTLIGDAAYVTLLFGAFALAQDLVPGLRDAETPVPKQVEPEAVAV